MRKVTKKLKVHRIISLVLVCVMVLTLLPPSTVKATESVSLETNKDTYEQGEGILVTATSVTPDDWVGLYKKGDSPSSAVPSYYWYYVNGSENGNTWMNGEEYNIFETVCGGRDKIEDGKGVPAGEYELILMASDYNVKAKKEITITSSQEGTDSSLEIEKDVVEFGEAIRVKPTSYNTNAWVGIYAGEYSENTDFSKLVSLEWKYVDGRNKTYVDFGSRPAGTYTLLLTSDGDYTVDKIKHVTVKNADTEILKTDKKSYDFDEPIYVTVNDEIGDSDWVGLYKKNEIPGGAITSFYYYYPSKSGNIHNIYDVDPNCNQRAITEAGEYTIFLLANDGYDVLASVDITISHEFGDWIFDSSARKHTRTCTGVNKHTETEECDFEKETLEEGVEYTCKVCKGSYVETHTYEYQYNNDKKTHTKICTDESCDVVAVEECKFEESMDDNNVTSTCKICGGSYTEPRFSTDKTEYKYGDAINVTVKGYGGSDWVGIYKKGETYNPDNGGVKSIFWYYVTEQPQTVNILSTRNENGRSSEYIGGDYTIVLFKDGGYIPAKTIDITVTAEIDETKTVIVAPTCEKDGSITYTYTDETKETITAEKDKSLEKLGHDYDADDNSKDDWTYNKDDKTHTKECVRCTAEDGCSECEKAVVTEGCEWNKGEVTKEPTTTENGEKTYTCTICGGTYIEAISAKVAVGEEVIKEATCEEEGILRTYYDKIGGSDYIDTAIPKKGHAYPDEWTYDASTKKHSKVCGNDENHIKTEACSFSKEMKDGKFIYTCNVCNGSYEESVIKTDKKKYDIDEAINVTVNYEFGVKDWVGLYKKGETPDSTETVISFIYYYPQEDGKTFNIFDSKYHQRGDVEPGEYTLFLCADNGYTVIASVDITIGHEFGEWKYDADTKTHSRTCDGSMKHQEGPVECTFESKITKEPTVTETGIETFTCTECGGSYEEVLPATSSTIVDTVTIDPTCETDGKIIFTYSDGTVKEEVIEKLGHDYDEENYTFNEADKTHSCVCKNDSSHVKTMNCNFNRTAMDGDKATYECTVCGGMFEDGLLVVSKDTYSASEDINVIASCDSNDSWVGLYKVDDEYGSVVSYYWYYVVSSGINRDGKTVNLTDKAFYNVERLDSMTPGEYKIVLFGDGGYDKIIAEKTITITEVSTTYDMKINGKEVSDGEVLQFKDDEAVSVTVTANGNPGTSWVGIYTAHYTKDTDFKGIGSADFFWVSENNGKKVNLKGSLREPGDYCLVIFGDHGHDYVKKIVYYTFTKDGAEKILIEPTCTKPGIKYVKYDDGSDAYVPIAKLGHDVKSWTYDDETKTHSGVCERVIGDKACGKTVKEGCQFDVTEDEESGKTYTCIVCNGQYTDTVIPYEEETDRIYGDTRYETATKIADQLKEEQDIEKFNNIIIASGTGYADALSGTYLAKVKDAPILLVNSKSTESMKKIAEYVNDNLAKDGMVYILGGKAAISDTFKSYLKMDSDHIKRLGGATRYETNLLILKEAGVTGGEILVCTGNNFADSLSASAVGRPILLTNNKALSTAQKNFLKGMKDEKYFIIGGKNAISYDMADSIRDFGGTERISGTTRYETSIKIAKKFIDSPKSMVLAYGKDFPDGLAGGMLALNMDAPLILITDNYKDSAVDYAKDNNITSGKVLGGTIRISEAVAKEVFGVAEDK